MDVLAYTFESRYKDLILNKKDILLTYCKPYNKKDLGWGG